MRTVRRSMWPLFWILSLILAACAGPAPAPTPAPEMAPTAVPASSGAEAPVAFDVQGHRGARGLRPENTLPAFEIALDLGVTTLELDLHFSADDQVVIWHDPAIDPAKCRVDPATSPADLALRQLTADQLAAFLCDLNPEPGRFPDQVADPTPLAGGDYGIVTLARLFDFVDAYAAAPSKTDAQRENARRVRFNIETKRKPDQPAAIGDGFDGTSPGPFEQAILALIAERGLVDRVVIQSFDHRSLWAVHSTAPDIALAVLTSQTPRPKDIEAWAAAGAAILSPNAARITAATVIQAHDAGLRIIPWTVNNPEDMRRLMDFGVDGLISDRPDLLLELIPPSP